MENERTSPVTHEELSRVIEAIGFATVHSLAHLWLALEGVLAHAGINARDAVRAVAPDRLETLTSYAERLAPQFEQMVRKTLEKS